MHHKHFRFILAFGSAFGLGLNQAHADGQSKPQSKNTTTQNQSDPFTNVNLIEGMKSGLIDAKALIDEQRHDGGVPIRGSLVQHR